MRRRREGTNWPRSLSILGGKASNMIAQFALDFPRKESVCRSSCGVTRAFAGLV
jgi:hypothetical protein